MFNRCTQISGFKPLHIGQQRINLIQGHLDRNDGRWAVWVKWIGHILNHGKGGMRVQQIKPRHTLWPVGQGAQGEKRWRRSNRAHAVVVHHVTTRTLRLRHLQSQPSIARKIDHLFNCILDLWNNKPVARFGGKGQNGILRNLALQPVNKAFGLPIFVLEVDLIDSNNILL